MADLTITVAGGRYDRVIPIIYGQVHVPGLEIRYLPMNIDEVFWRAFRYHEFEASELSLSYYMALRSRGDDTYVAIPVFPSRFFRQGCVFVRTDSSLETLDGLRGRAVGLPEYGLTACVWLRGLLRDQCGIEPSEIRWRSGGMESPGRHPRAPLSIPQNVDLAEIDAAQTLTDELASGNLDAIFSPRVPSELWRGQFRHLVRNYHEEEVAYFRHSKIFPAMHVVGLRRDVYETYPWVARALFAAYQQAKQTTYQWLSDVDALPISLPWYLPAYEEMRREFGADPWIDGLEPNRRMLETFYRYLRQQGLADEMNLDEFFAAPTREDFVI